MAASLPRFLAVASLTDGRDASQIIYPQETVLRALAAKIDSIDAEADFAHLCEAKEVRKAVLLELNTIGKAAGLRSLEVRLILARPPFVRS